MARGFEGWPWAAAWAGAWPGSFVATAASQSGIEAGPGAQRGGKRAAAVTGRGELAKALMAGRWSQCGGSRRQGRGACPTGIMAGSGRRCGIGSRGVRQRIEGKERGERVDFNFS